MFNTTSYQMESEIALLKAKLEELLAKGREKSAELALTKKAELELETQLALSRKAEHFDPYDENHTSTYWQEKKVEYPLKTSGNTKVIGGYVSSGGVKDVPGEIDCNYGIKCLKSECLFKHPIEWNSKVAKESYPCKNRDKCTYVKCLFGHPFGWNPIKKNCISGIRCFNSGCKFNHPPDWIYNVVTVKETVKICTPIHPTTKPVKKVTFKDD